MASNSWWIKQDCDWMEREWLIVLSAESRLAWNQLRCLFGERGRGGRMKIMPLALFARRNYIGEESVEQMLRAAKAAGELREDGGEWILTEWEKIQNPDSARKARSRNVPDKPGHVPDGPADDGTIRTPLTRDQDQEEDLEGESPLTPLAESNDFGPPTNHHMAVGLLRSFLPPEFTDSSMAQMALMRWADYCGNARIFVPPEDTIRTKAKEVAGWSPVLLAAAIEDAIKAGSRLWGKFAPPRNLSDRNKDQLLEAYAAYGP